MAPKKLVPKLTADTFEAQYGSVVRAEFSEIRTPYLLQKALAARKPAIQTTVALLKVWFLKTSMAEGSVKVDSAEELQEQYGEVAIRLSIANPSAFLLCKALKSEQPPVYITDDVCKGWLEKYVSTLELVHSAGRLELKYGDRIRSQAEGLSSADLRLWLRQYLQVDCTLPVCETWRCKDWSTSSKILSIHKLECEFGDKLRLPQYEPSFDNEAVEVLAQELEEHVPPVRVSSVLLAQWYTKYHPGSGPLHIEDAQQLEEHMGDSMRQLYSGLGSA